MSDPASESIEGASREEGVGSTSSATGGETSTEAGKSECQDVQPMDDSQPLQSPNELVCSDTK